MNRITTLAVTAAAFLLTACANTPPPNPAAQARVEDAATMITPMTQKRETLVATGYAVISIQNHRNPAQQRLLAIRASKLDAYRALTEQVYGQQLDASTTVADMTVMSDTFRTPVPPSRLPNVGTTIFTVMSALAAELPWQPIELLLDRAGWWKHNRVAWLGCSSLPAALAQSQGLTPAEVFRKVSPSVWMVRALDASEKPIRQGSGVVAAPSELTSAPGSFVDGASSAAGPRTRARDDSPAGECPSSCGRISACDGRS